LGQVKQKRIEVTQGKESKRCLVGGINYPAIPNPSRGGEKRRKEKIKKKEDKARPCVEEEEVSRNIQWNLLPLSRFKGGKRTHKNIREKGNGGGKNRTSRKGIGGGRWRANSMSNAKKINKWGKGGLHLDKA